MQIVMYQEGVVHISSLTYGHDASVISEYEWQKMDYSRGWPELLSNIESEVRRIQEMPNSGLLQLHTEDLVKVSWASEANP